MPSPQGCVAVALSSSLHDAPRSLLTVETRACGGERTASRLARVGTPFQAGAAHSAATRRLGDEFAHLFVAALIQTW